MGALDHVAASATDLHPMVAPLIEKEECLFSCLQPLFDPIEEFRRKVGKTSRLIERLFHVDDFHSGNGTRGSRFERVQLVFAALSVVTGFDRGGGATEKDGAIFKPGSHDRDISAVISGGLVALFIGVVVLFIDDDQAEILCGAENR